MQNIAHDEFMSLTMHSATDRPDLWERGIPSESVWPEYNMHGDVLNRWWGHLDEDLPEFQFVLHDDTRDEVVAEGHTGPLWWDGLDETLPDGIDAAIEQIFSQVRAGEPVNTLCALAAESPREGRARGLAAQLLKAMRNTGNARADAFDRSGSALCEGALSVDAHRPLCPVASRGRADVRSLDAHPRKSPGSRLDPAAQVVADHGHG